MIELYIDRGKNNDEENITIFEQLYHHKEQIEEIFGEPLEWRKLEDKRAKRIVKTLTNGGYQDQEQWPEIQQEMIESMIKLEKALSGDIKNVKL